MYVKTVEIYFLEVNVVVAKLRVVWQQNRPPRLRGGEHHTHATAVGIEHTDIRTDLQARAGHLELELVIDRAQAAVGGVDTGPGVHAINAGGVVADQSLPRPRIGDFLVFHNAGAYGASMSSNYNSRPLAADDFAALLRARG